MVYFKVIALLIFIGSIPTSIRSEVAEWITKQDPFAMRYVSEDGKISFFQKPSGNLIMANNYSVKDVLSAKPEDLIIVSSPLNSALEGEIKTLLFSKRENFLGNFDPLKLEEIYLYDIKSEKTEFVTKGIMAKLHLNSQWMSWYIPQSRNIHFLNLKDRAINFTISLNKKIDRYFFPEVIMINPNIIIYTDSDESDSPSLIQLDRTSKKNTIITQSTYPGSRIEICQNQTFLVIGIFPTLPNGQKSSINTIAHQDGYSDNNIKEIFSSNELEIGRITCRKDEQVYFIRNISSPDTLLPKTDLYSIDTKTKKIEQLTHWGDLIQYISLPSSILTPRNGRIYTIKGETNITQDQLEKSL